MSHTKVFLHSIRQAWVLDTEIQNPHKLAEASFYQIRVFICPGRELGDKGGWKEGQIKNLDIAKYLPG